MAASLAVVLFHTSSCWLYYDNNITIKQERCKGFLNIVEMILIKKASVEYPAGYFPLVFFIVHQFFFCGIADKTVFNQDGGEGRFPEDVQVVPGEGVSEPVVGIAIQPRVYSVGEHYSAVALRPMDYIEPVYICVGAGIGVD